MNKEIKGIVSNFYIKFRVQKPRFLFFSQGPGRFKELRGPGRKHFHLSWYLSVSVVTSYDQKPWGGFFFNGYGIMILYVFYIDFTFIGYITP